MAVSEAHTRASVKYNRARDSITLRPDKAVGMGIRDAAAVAGQSLQAYILQACRERMEREESTAPE